ncbi:sorting nexin-33 [Condylostylus longicornis]|uniref:sorting nexin-33 n=1 Tax=Condylostylus longicornis TaxID=2530218 RepID=UPI00244DF0A4|nr:sorting nexin-33 [Condylostylus longicornis]
MTTYVKALYDFSGEANSSELSIATGEVLTVTRTDVGEGWWEGKNSKGEIGLFPAAYVQYMSAAEYNQQQNGVSTGFSPLPTPATTLANSNSLTGSRYDQTTDEWNDGQDEWEDDWDDDNEYSEIGPSPGQANTSRQQASSNQYHQQNQQQVNYANLSLPATPGDDTASISSNSQSATIKKSSLFSKTCDPYILGGINLNVPENEKVSIIQIDNYYFWQNIASPYTVRVASPKKETKFKGMKSFIAYQLTPSFNNIAVSRRYKHFDWLHKRLVDKFPLIPIPPLPDKQISGRYEEEFVEHRRVQLQEFVDWVCRHPVLSSCEVWMHFLTCTDEKKWKMGKRTAEKDPLVGFDYCTAIFPPEKQLLQSYVDSQIDNCTAFVHAMDAAVKTLLSIAAEQTKRNQVVFKRDFQRIGDGFAELAKALEYDERRYSTGESLSTSVGKTGGYFILMGQIFGEQPKHDWIPFSDRFHIYRGILNSFPDILSAHKGAMQKKKECERLTSDQKMGNAQLVEVGRRTDIVSYAVLAEISHFRTERDVHLKQTICNLIDTQIEFYMKIVGKLQEARKQFQ